MKSSILNLTSKLATLAVLTAGLLSMGAQAQTASGYHYKVNIPFQFTVENKVMPAGTYFVDLSGHFIRLSLKNTNQSIASPAGDVGVSKAPEEATLVFNVYGERYFLARLLLPGSDVGKEIPKAWVEGQIAPATAHTQVVALAH